MKTGMSAEDNAVAEANPRWMTILNTDTMAIVAKSGIFDSPMDSNVIADSHSAAPEFSSKVPNEMPIAKTTSVPQFTMLSSCSQSSTPILGISMSAIPATVMVEESSGCKIPSVDHSNNMTAAKTANRISLGEMGPSSARPSCTTSLPPGSTRVSGLMVHRITKYKTIDMSIDHGAPIMNQRGQEKIGRAHV